MSKLMMASLLHFFNSSPTYWSFNVTLTKPYQVLRPPHCNFLILLGGVGNPPKAHAKASLSFVVVVAKSTAEEIQLTLHGHNGFLQPNLEGCLPSSLLAKRLVFGRKRAAGKAWSPTKGHGFEQV